ncbi:MAG TPA: hypothetical protein VGF06_03975 [Terriglobales bacterium]|jgi:hypothetical protein
MRKLTGLALFLCLLSGFAVAAPKAQVFGGYQYTHLDPSLNMNGWDGSITLNSGSFLGITGDFSGTYKNGLHFYTYTVGPEVHADLPVLKPFVHALVGGGRTSFAGASDNGFVVMVGGGLDAGSGPIAFRLVQFDWMDTRFNGFNATKNVRAAVGVVLRF